MGERATALDGFGGHSCSVIYRVYLYYVMAFQADSIFWVEVEKIVPNPYQPRREFDEAKLKELSESVRMYGILQPLTVTRKEIQGPDGSFRSEYELIAGERRLRASKLAGLSLVPVIIRDGEQTEQEKLELAIIENLQREDLNAVDRALAFRQLADVFGLSHSQVAQKVGRSREYVSNSIRLLALPDYMLASLRTNDITEGHARTLLMLNDRPEEQDVVFREILLKKLSVREVEKIARSIATEKVRKKELVDNDLIEIEKQFTDALGTRVSITKTDFGGRVTIDYFSIEDLETMLERMKQDAAAAKQPVSDVYKDESKDTEVSDTVDEEMLTLAQLAAATGIEPVLPNPISEVVSEPEAVAVAPMPETNTAPAEVVVDVTVAEVVVPTPEPAPAPVAATTPTTPVTPPVAAAVPPTPVAPVTQTPAPATQGSPKSNLRDQLASLLGKRDGAVLPATETKPAPVAPQAQPSASVAAAETTPAPTVPETKPEDESDLYSINRFTV